MKNFITQSVLLIFSLFLVLMVHAQNVGINSTGATPDPSAVLDLNVITGGFAMPRLTEAQRDNIATLCSCTPVDGLQIYNTSSRCFEAYVAGAWRTVSCPCPAPGSPTSGTHTSTETQITWNWNAVSGVTGYKYNPVNDFSTATDHGTNISYTETGLSCGKPDTLYVWSYDDCGNSIATMLRDTTSTCTTTVAYTTPGVFDFVVPAGVTNLLVKAWGAGGGGSTNGPDGGGGGFAQGTLTVSAAQTYKIAVGGGGGTPTACPSGGAGGTNGGGAGGGCGSATITSGGGGGYSGVFLSSVSFANARIIGGGGGGAGGSLDGGAGGGTNGQDGEDAGYTSEGHGATQSAGGASGSNGNAGTALQGGNGVDGISGVSGAGSGGGGGGYYGGGSGGYICCGHAGGGGGGSGYVSGANTTITTGSGTSVANNGDADYVAPAGAGSTTTANGSDGRVVLIYW